MIGWAVFVALAILSGYAMIGLSVAVWRQVTRRDHDTGRQAAKDAHPAYRQRVIRDDDWQQFVQAHKELS